MNHFYRRLICMFLCFCMVVQPIVFNAALAENVKVYENGYTKGSLADKLNDSASAVSDAQSADKGKTDSSVKPSDTDKANASSSLNDASAEMGKIGNSSSDISSASKAATAAVSQNDNSSVGALTSTTAKIQDTLFKVGNTLVNIGTTLKSVGQALQLIGGVLKAIPWTHAIGVVLENIGKILYRVGTVVENIGNVIIKTAQIASSADDLFGTLLGNIPNAIKDGWKKGGEEADAYSEQLNSQLSKNDTSKSQEKSTTETKDSNSETTKDADQGDIADI